MRCTIMVAFVFGCALVACSTGSSNDAGPTDSGTSSGPDVQADGLSCAEYTRVCPAQTLPYGLCCTDCPTGFSCAYANPGVDAGTGTAVLMCTQMCQHLADCPAAGSAAGICVLGLCFQTCDPTTGGACPPAEGCIPVFGRNVCAAVTCN